MTAEQTKASNFGVINALLVDDNMFDRQRFKRIYSETSINFLLKEASGAREFGEALDQEKFDVIYVDLNLGATNGMMLLPIIRAHKVNKNAAVIMVTGENQADVALNALREGFADYIEKDVLTSASLERATVNALQKSHLSNAAVSAEAATKTVESVLSSFSQVCTDEMRPLMARMMRQVRQLKADGAAYGLSESIVQIESTCMRIEEFFQDLSGLRKEGQLSSFVGESLKGQGNASLPRRVKTQEPQHPPVERAVKPKQTTRPSLFS